MNKQKQREEVKYHINVKSLTKGILRIAQKSSLLPWQAILIVAFTVPFVQPLLGHPATIAAQPVSCSRSYPLTLSLNPPDPIPQRVSDILQCAGDYPQTPAYQQWLAPAGDPTTEITSSFAGQTSIALGYHNIATIGYKHNETPPGTPAQSTWVVDSDNLIDNWVVTVPAGAPPADVSNLDPHGALTGFNDTPGFTAQHMHGFNLTSSAFADGEYTITFYRRSINHFANGDHTCVAGDENPTSAGIFDPCASIPTNQMTITVNPVGGGYDHEATLSSCTPDTAKIEAGKTTITCNPGMNNNGDKDGPQTVVEFYEYKQQGTRTTCIEPPPGPGQDSKLTGYYDCQNSAMFSGDPPQEHFLWVRSSTPNREELKPDWSVQYSPVQFKVKAGTPKGTKLCFATKVTADPYGAANSVFSDAAVRCFIVDEPPPPCPGAGCPGDPGNDPNPDNAACITANPGVSGFPGGVPITLPDKRSHPANTPSKPASGGGQSTNGYGGLPGPVTQDVEENNPYKITSAKDEWGQSTTTNASVGSRSDNPFKISYQSFIDDYPLDFHSPKVDYSQYYTRHTWTASYDSRSSSTKPATTCPKPPKGCIPKQAITTYTWSYSYKDSTSPQTATASITPTTGGLVTMKPCYDRAFRNVTPNTTAPLFDDEEQPTKVTFVAGSNVEMYIPTPPGNKGLRASLKVKLDVSADYYIKHANGSRTSFSEGRQTNVLSANNIMFDSGRTSPNTYNQSFTDVFNAHIPPLTAGDKACVTITSQQKQGTMTVAGDRTSSSGSASTSESCSQPLVNKPYFKVFGGDVIAGGAFSGGTCSQTGTVTAFYNQLAAAGASGQFAAQSIGQITEFGSDQLRSSGTPTRPLGLSFANNGTNVSYPAMGGNFGGSHCITDYWSTKPASTAVQALDSYNNVAGAKGAVYFKPPSGTITLSGGANTTGSKTIYVEGNVILSGEFSYENSVAWANQNAIPSLFIIAKGNIYIDSGTGQLDGVFIAQPTNVLTPTDGKIYTCANGTTPVAISSLFTSCNKQLTINGAFIASQVKLLRTNGSLRHATSNEQLTGAPHSCSPSGLPAAPVCAAEIFNFTPEIFLSQPSLPLIRSAYEGKYDYITSLPPLL